MYSLNKYGYLREYLIILYQFCGKNELTAEPLNFSAICNSKLIIPLRL